MSFLVDMPLSPALAEWLMQRGHDAVHATNIGLARSSDSLILERARGERRVIVTADLHYPRLLAVARARGPGIVLFRGGDFSESETIDGLQRVLRAIAVPDLHHSIVVVERTRIRRRPLPIGP